MDESKSIRRVDMFMEMAKKQIDRAFGEGCARNNPDYVLRLTAAYAVCHAGDAVASEINGARPDTSDG